MTSGDNGDGLHTQLAQLRSEVADLRDFCEELRAQNVLTMVRSEAMLDFIALTYPGGAEARVAARARMAAEVRRRLGEELRAYELDDPGLAARLSAMLDALGHEQE
ncbi:MAG: hypothetical protein HZA93_24020 [Verrucomicrobia bacterium]|nr:hypothetical protein [Verrucomicrobiota bacterium]